MKPAAARGEQHHFGPVYDLPNAPTADVIGIGVTALSFEAQISRMVALAKAPDCSHFVCVANVHMLVEAQRRPEFRAILKAASMVTPDGMPLVWLMRRGGYPDQERVAGMDLLPALAARAAREGIPIFLLGATGEVLEKLAGQLLDSNPGLQIADSHAPPFRRLSEVEDRELVERINASGAEMLLIALGCPKQEEWMYEHRESVRPLMVGLGAAFGVVAGMQRRAPLAMQQSGLEWLFRLAQEPRRLWRRYLVTNSLFCWYVLRGAFRAGSPGYPGGER